MGLSYSAWSPPGPIPDGLPERNLVSLVSRVIAKPGGQVPLIVRKATILALDHT